VCSKYLRAYKSKPMSLSSIYIYIYHHPLTVSLSFTNSLIPLLFLPLSSYLFDKSLSRKLIGKKVKILYNVHGTGPLLTTKCTVYVLCWTPKCNVLGYWWHHSICYTRLFTTPLVVITTSPYNEPWPSDVLSRSGPWISSISVCPEHWQLRN
jgi:hypothetical protein